MMEKLLFVGFMLLAYGFSEIENRHVERSRKYNFYGGVEEFIPWAFLKSAVPKRGNGVVPRHTTGLPKSPTRLEKNYPKALPSRSHHSEAVTVQSGSGILNKRREEDNGLSQRDFKSRPKTIKAEYLPETLKQARMASSGAKNLKNSENWNETWGGGEKAGEQRIVTINGHRWKLFKPISHDHETDLQSFLEKFDLQNTAISLCLQNSRDNKYAARPEGMDGREAGSSSTAFICWPESVNKRLAGDHKGVLAHAQVTALIQSDIHHVNLPWQRDNPDGKPKQRSENRADKSNPALDRAHNNTKGLKIRITPGAKLSGHNNAVSLILRVQSPEIKIEQSRLEQENHAVSSNSPLKNPNEDALDLNVICPSDEINDPVALQRLLSIVGNLNNDACLSGQIEDMFLSLPSSEDFLVLHAEAICKLVEDWQICLGDAKDDPDKSNIVTSEMSFASKSAKVNKAPGKLTVTRIPGKVQTSALERATTLKPEQRRSSGKSHEGTRDEVKNWFGGGGSRIEHQPVKGFEWESNMIFF